MSQELVTTDDLELAAFSVLPFVRAVVDNEGAVTKLLEQCLNRALETLQNDLQTYWRYTVIKQSTTEPGDDYEVESGQDFKRGEAMNWAAPRFVMRRSPVVSIQQVSYGFNNRSIFGVPDDWVTPRHKIGVVNIVPVGYSATAAVTFNSGHSPLIGPNSPFSLIPEMVHIDYTAGYYDPEGTSMPADANQVREGILDKALYFLLDRAAGIIPGSSSAGSVSQSFMAPEQRLEWAQKKVDEFETYWKRHYRPIQMVIA